MKKILLLGLLMSCSAWAQMTLYQFKDENGTTLLTNRKSEKYDSLEEIKNTYYPNVNLHGECGKDCKMQRDNQKEIKQGNGIELDKLDILSAREQGALGIVKFYKDSKILIKNENDYLEVNDFNNGVKSIRFVNDISGVQIFGDSKINNLKQFGKSAWYVNCKKDHITDEKICIMNKPSFNFSVGISKNRDVRVFVGNDGLDETFYQYIRIDKNTAFKTKKFFKGKSALSIINQMKKGDMAYTRFYKYNEDEHEESIPLFGFDTAYDSMNIMCTSSNLI